jgi:hypothetical protein
VTPLLNTVRISTTANTIDYYAVGAIQAHEIPEGMEYPEEAAVWAKSAKTAKVTKKGLKVPITQELIDDNLFDVMSMYIRAAGRAMARYKEQLALARFLAAAHTEFDNTSGTDTTGVNSLGDANGSLDGHDLLTAFGVMLASGRTPTDIIMHPMAWTMWADDPILRNLTVYRQPVGSAQGMQLNDGTVAGATFDAFIRKTSPFGINVITSPYVPFTAGTPAKTDILIIDRNDVGVVTIREDMTSDQWNDPSRDIVAMKVKERYDITIMDTEGYNVVSLENINLVRNYGQDVAFTSDHANKFPGEV